jgi:hypothetical protein
MESTTTGSHNIAFGYEALKTITEGDKNIAIGYRAGKTHTTSDSMLYIGNDATSTLIKGDMANKFLAVGSADVTLSTENATLQVYPIGSHTAYFAKMPSSHTGDLIRIENSSGTNLFLVDNDGILTSSGIIKTDDTTDATSTTDGSLQTDGGLSVAKDCIFGNDVKLLTDSSVLSLGVGSDATFTHDGTTGLTIAANPITLDSGAAINIEPAAGSVILLDGTISIDAGVVTGATSITSTAFVGDITGDVTGNASGTALTVTQAAQSAITSVGTLTTLTVDSIIINGTTIGHTSDTDAITIASGGKVTFSQAHVGAVTALTSQSGSVTINAALSNYFTVATTGAISGLDITNAVVGQRILIRFAWGGTHSIAYTDTVIWPGGTALSVTASGVDVIGFICTTASSAFDAFIVGEDVKAV